MFIENQKKKILHNICVCLHVAYTSMTKKMKFKINHIDISYFGVMNQVPKQNIFCKCCTLLFLESFGEQKEENKMNRMYFMNHVC